MAADIVQAATGLSEATTIRRLLRSRPCAALGTIDRDHGEPCVSLVRIAVDHGAAPLLYLSEKADPTKNLRADPRASLLLDTTSPEEVPPALESSGVRGRLEPTDDASLLGRFLARHPDAWTGQGSADARLYRMTVERAHLMTGDDPLRWIDAADILIDAGHAGALAGAEAAMVAHMNEDHADAVRLYAEVLLRREAGPWLLAGIDPEGVDLRLGAKTARLWFDAPVVEVRDARLELVRLLDRARGIETARA